MPGRPLLLAAASLFAGCASRPGVEVAALPVRPFEGVTVLTEAHEVRIDAVACLDEGWLEQVACSPGTREHESLIVVKALPSQVHAALLLAGFEPGAPGRWTQDGTDLRLEPPTGDRLEVFVSYVKDGAAVEEPIGAWITDDGGARFPEVPWVFGGSVIARNPEWMGPGEHYVADQTGSIIGLVTFGDEVIGWSTVMSDQEAVQPLEWKVGDVPPVGTPVVLIVRKAPGAFSRGDD